MNFSSEESQEVLDINVTPLIDIVFLLLIFLMVTTSFNEGPQIKVDLPSSSADARESKAETLTISIKASGELYNQDQLLNRDQLQALLKEKKASRDKVTLVIRADKGTSHGAVVDVMDAATKYGIHDLAIATDR